MLFGAGVRIWCRAMAGIEISKTINAAVEAVWAELERVEKHSEWMTDAIDVRFDDEQRRGVGTRITVATKVGPFRTADRMEFVRWDPLAAMGVRHRGLIGGEGVFTLTANDDATTTVTWREDLEFPWYLGRSLGAWLARPVLRHIWRGNLENLAARL